MPRPCRAHAVPLPRRASKGLECVFPIWFTQCGRVWFTSSRPRQCHAPTMPFFSRLQHSTAVERRSCCAVSLRRTAWLWHGMASVNQTRPHCVNQTGKTHSKPLAARHGRRTAWVRHGHGKLWVNRPLWLYSFFNSALEGVGLLIPRSGHFTPGKETRFLPRYRIWVDPRAGLGECGKPRPHRDSIPRQSIP